MKVNKIIKSVEEAELEIIGATLLSIEEAEKLPMRLKRYDECWWTRSPGDGSNSVLYIEKDGWVYRSGHQVTNFEYSLCMVRPALEISNLKSSNLEIGDIFNFGKREFEVISDSLAFCTMDIGEYEFDYYSNDYENSEIKEYVDRWFNKVIANKEYID